MSNVLKHSSVVLETGAYLDTDAGERLRLIKNEHRERDSQDSRVRRAIDQTMTKNAAEKAEDIVSGALVQARQIIARANEDAIGIMEQARRDGLDQGRIDGFEQGVQQGTEQIEEYEKQKLADLQELCDRYERLSSQKLESLSSEALDFAFELTKKIVGTEIDKNDQAFVNIFRSAARHIGEAETVTLRVDEKGYEVATRCKKDLLKCINGLKTIEIELCEDTPGACVIETPAGSVDASVQTQTKRAAELAAELV